ncbi:helix-turn-helix transcriptional regulator [Aestuariivirga sp.]|uniref:helix-turn-helix transcriptional regulator n=1 Tax=Aestuariivirga sp. TaxID=2650926 RepID=UPI003593EEB6
MVTQFLRFKDLKARGIVASWPSLRYKIDHNGFPPGRYIGPNSRAWTVEEVQAWIDALPTENPRHTSRNQKVAA